MIESSRRWPLIRRETWTIRCSADEIWLRYRASVAHGLTLWLVTASAGEWQRTDVSVALAQRYSFAYADLDVSSALAETTG